MFPEDLLKRVTNPENEHLHEVEPNAENLDKERKQTFHTITAWFLFCRTQAIPDLQPMVAFLCTWVTEHDVDNWKN